MPRPRMFRPSIIKKEFTDREESRAAFWDGYTSMDQQKGNSTVISFFGAGGIGKSALFKNLQLEVEQRNEKLERLNRYNERCYYVRYDFSIGTNVQDVLKNLKVQLTHYGCKFPLFDIGNYYYSLKMGRDATIPRQPTMFEQLPWVKTLKKQLSQAGAFAGNAMTLFSTTRNIFSATAELNQGHWLDTFLKTTIGGLGTSMPIMRTITILMSVADMFLEDYMRRNNLVDAEHQFIRNELNNCRQKKDPGALYEYLPSLFAMDVSDWMKSTESNLIVFLDNYESLAGTTNFKAAEQRNRDLWLRGYEGLIYQIPNTLWVIAGRNELCWDGELGKELKQHEIKALSYKHAKSYLQKAGIDDENLIDGLIKLTEGYPLFLDLCVDVYVEYTREHNNEKPPLEEFGQGRDAVVERILRYINTAGGATVIDMLEFVCMLKIWTDYIVYEIGPTALPGFSPNTYEFVKNVSFIRSEISNDADLDLEREIFRFDNTIHSLLLAACKKNKKYFVEKVKESVNEYFKKFFAFKKVFDAEESFYLKLWTEFILRFADDVEKIFQQYKNLLHEFILTLINRANFDAAEEVLMLFMNKLENLQATETLTYTYFETDFGQLRQAQGKYKEAHKIIKSVYRKRVRLLGKDHPETVKAKYLLAISFNNLGRYKGAIEFHRKVLDFRKKTLGKEHLETVESMHRLATSLNESGKYAEALELREKVLILRKKILGEEHPDTIAAMNNLAVSLSSLGRYKDALELREKVLSLYKKIHSKEYPETNGEEHPDTIDAMHNLAVSFSSLDRDEDALKLRKKVLSLYKKIYGNNHPDTIAAISNLALSFSSLEHYGRALTLQKIALKWYKNTLGEKHPRTLIAMHNLADSYNNLKRYEDALELQKKALSSQNFVSGENKSPYTIAMMNSLAMTLCMLERYEKAVTMQEDVLNSYKKILGEEHPHTIIAMDNLAISLTFLKRYEDALPLCEKILSLHRKKSGEDATITLRAADSLAHILSKVGRREEAIALQRETLAKCERLFDTNNPLTITVTKNLAAILSKNGQREEAIKLIERATAAAKQFFGDDHSETKEILKLREEILNA